MKKRIAVVLLAVMTLTMVACGTKDENVESSTGLVEIESSVIVEEESSVAGSEEASDAVVVESAAADMLNTIWASYAEEDKFAIAGGDYSNMSYEGPAACDPTNSADLDTLFGFPAAHIDNIDDAASMMHAMNQNTFTAAVYHVTDAANVQALADDMKANILARQWMCGFPETLLIVSVDDYVIAAFGNGDMINTFNTKIAESYENAAVLHEAPIE